MALNADKFFFSSAASNTNLKSSPEVEEAVSERPKAFAAAHRSDEHCYTYIFASRLASSVIAKAKAEAWQATCSFLSLKSTYSLLRSVAGSSSSSFSSPNFPNHSPPRESTLVFADYLKSHFSVCLPGALRSTARGCLSEFRRATCPEEPYCYSCSPFTLAILLEATKNLYSSTVTGLNKVAYSMLKHLPYFGMDFLLHIFNRSWSLHILPSI